MGQHDDLLPLPELDFMLDGGALPCYYAEAMRLYARAAFAAGVREGRERAAKVADQVGYAHEVQQGAELAFDIAAAIRAMIAARPDPDAAPKGDA